MLHEGGTSLLVADVKERIWTQFAVFRNVAVGMTMLMTMLHRFEEY
jgi:hypothetical protein